MEYKHLKTYRQQPAGGWRVIEFVDLRESDVFMLCNPDGTFVEFKGEIILRAMSDTFLDEKRRTFSIDMTSLKEWRETV